jgi:hypothetical protein
MHPRAYPTGPLLGPRGLLLQPDPTAQRHGATHPSQRLRCSTPGSGTVNRTQQAGVHRNCRGCREIGARDAPLRPMAMRTKLVAAQRRHLSPALDLSPAASVADELEGRVSQLVCINQSTLICGGLHT